MKNAYKKLPLLAPLALVPFGAKAQQTPNVIIILADDLGYGDLQCYGAQNVQTPNVDRLAAQGIRFTNTHAVAATSTPSRYSLLTGEYAFRRDDTGIAAGNASMIIHPEQFTMADMFHSRGYATCAIGKWHLGLGDKTGEQDWNAPLPTALGDIGFDYHYIMAATADRVPCVFIEDGKVANYDESAPIEVDYEKNFEGEPTGRDNPELLFNLKPSHGHDMSIVNGISRIGYMKGGGKALWKDENIADSITVHAVNFIEANKDKPFFMYFCTNDVHVPRFPNERFRGKTNMGLRGDAIVEFDWSVGQIMETLERLGIADNTLVILTSDNGPVVDDGYLDQSVELLNGHSPSGGLRGGKYSAFEGGTMVPMIVSWPERVKKGLETDVLNSHIDLMSSLGSLIGARLPKGAARDSEDNMAVLLGEDSTDRAYVLEQSYYRSLSVRTKDWKYIEPCDEPAIIPWGPRPEVETGNLTAPQLFDMTKAIPQEQKNVAQKHPEKVYELQFILQQLRAQKNWKQEVR